MSEQVFDDNVIPFRRREDEVGGTTDGTQGVERELLDALKSGLDALEDDIDDADRAAIDDEDAFIHRFGFDSPRHRRRQVIELKHRADLTDREIRWLHRASGIAFDSHAASISVPILSTVFGCVQLLMLSCMMLLALLLAIGVTEPTVLRALHLGAIEFVLLALVWAVVQMHIRPHLIQRRVKAMRSVNRIG